MKGSAPALHVIGGMNLDAGQEKKGEEDELQKKIVKIIWNLYGFEWNPDPQLGILYLVTVAFASFWPKVKH